MGSPTLPPASAACPFTVQPAFPSVRHARAGDWHFQGVTCGHMGKRLRQDREGEGWGQLVTLRSCGWAATPSRFRPALELAGFDFSLPALGTESGEG